MAGYTDDVHVFEQQRLTEGLTALQQGSFSQAEPSVPRGTCSD